MRTRYKRHSEHEHTSRRDVIQLFCGREALSTRVASGVLIMIFRSADPRVESSVTDYTNTLSLIHEDT